MTDRADLPDPPDVDDDVELASALLDGEVAPDERARVDDPAVQAHLASFRAVSAQVAVVPPVPEGLLDRHVAAALDAYDEDLAGGHGPTVVPLRRTWWQRAPLGAVAAVLAVVALVGAVGLASIGGDEDADTATAAFDEPGGDAEAFSTTADDQAARSDAAGAGGGAGTGGRMAYASLDELADDLAARRDLPRQEAAAEADAAPMAGTADAPEPSDGQVEGCDALAASGVDEDEVLEVVAAVVDGTEVTAVVHGDPDAPRLVVVDDAACQVLVARDL